MPSILGWGRATQALGSMSSLLGEGYSGPGFNARSIVESTQALGLMHAKSIGPGGRGTTQALGLMSGLLLGLLRPWV